MTSTKLLHALRDPLRTRQRLLDGFYGPHLTGLRLGQQQFFSTLNVQRNGSCPIGPQGW